MHALPNILFYIFRNFAEGQDKVINFKNISFDVIEAFTKYVKTGHIKANGTLDKIDMLKFAHQYNIEFLFESCSKMLQNSINKENLDEMIEVASLLGEEDLQERIAFFISVQPDCKTMILDSIFKKN